jgi:hypothetical protein
MKFRIKTKTWLLVVVVAILLFLDLVFLGFIGIPAKCYYHTSTQDVKFCHAFFQAEYWEERPQETWDEYIYIKSYRHDFIIQPAEYLIEKVGNLV